MQSYIANEIGDCLSLKCLSRKSCGYNESFKVFKSKKVDILAEKMQSYFANEIGFVNKHAQLSWTDLIEAKSVNILLSVFHSPDREWLASVLADWPFTVVDTTKVLKCLSRKRLTF